MRLRAGFTRMAELSEPDMVAGYLAVPIAEWNRLHERIAELEAKIKAEEDRRADVVRMVTQTGPYVPFRTGGASE